MSDAKRCPAPGHNGKPCGRAVRAGGLCVSHYQQQRRGEDLRPLRGPGGRIGEVALETVIVRLSPEVIAELDRVQGKKKRAETMRLVLAIWASGQAKEREGREVPIDLERHASPEETERRRSGARAFLEKVTSPKRKREPC